MAKLGIAWVVRPIVINTETEYEYEMMLCQRCGNVTTLSRIIEANPDADDLHCPSCWNVMEIN